MTAIIPKLKKALADSIGELPQVEGIDVASRLEVIIKLNTRDRRARKAVFERELQIHKAFPDLLIGFRVILP